MKKIISLNVALSIFGAALLTFNVSNAKAQEYYPEDTGLPSSSYHTSPRYRSSEEHPLRIMAYVLNPIGWVVREGITRPLSYFASSTEKTRSVMGFREPFDYRRPECFSADDTTPDCRSIAPFNYEDTGRGGALEGASSDVAAWNAPAADRYFYFPDVNFEFDKHTLTDLGRGRLHQIAKLLEQEPGLTVMLGGHADYKGGDEYNEKLSAKRAETVRQGLVDLGLDPARVQTMGFGKSSPALTDETDWARAVNRRVEIRPAS